MQAIRFHEHGGPEVLRNDKLPDPVPGVGEVLVRVRARGINRAEILTVQGVYPRKPKFPALIGREGAGVIEDLGAGVSTFKKGDRVMLRNGAAIGGTWCELVRVPAKNIIATPNNIDDMQAGGVFVSYLTAWIGLSKILGLKRGDSVILTAASSPTGLAALQVCHHLGVHSIATTRRKERVSALRDAGADQVWLGGDPRGLVDKVRDWTQGKGASAAFDAVSGPLGEACYHALSETGRLVLYGALSLEPMKLSPGSLIYKQKKVEGFWLTRILESWPRERLDEVYEDIVLGLKKGVFVPRVHRSFDLSHAAEAFAEMNEQRHFGKVVLSSI